MANHTKEYDKIFGMNKSVSNLKTALRSSMRAKRKALSREERQKASETICGKLLRDTEIKASTPQKHAVIAVYMASPDEIDLTDFIIESLKSDITIVSPRWDGEKYELAKIKGLDARHMRKGPMNILEPADAEIVAPNDVAIWIIPGLAFSLDGKRLGYGGGWYDRLLSAASATSLKFGVAHSFQIADDIPVEPHDIRLDKTITD